MRNHLWSAPPSRSPKGSAVTVLLLAVAVAATTSCSPGSVGSVDRGEEGTTSLTVHSGERVVLDGSGLFGGGAATYSWEQLDGPAITIADPTAATLTFIAPNVTSTTRMTFLLTARRAERNATTLFTVTVLPPGAPFDGGVADGEDGGGDAGSSTTIDSSIPTGDGLWPRLAAFPSAEGFGTDTVGGRGGAIIEVTTLNDDGPGSLRAALEASGPRIVVFRVSGTIVLGSRIEVTNPYVTVAGQTAPGGGITLRMDPTDCIDQGPMTIYTHDVVVRYIRFRPGPNSCADDSHDGLTIYQAGVHDVVIDHCSFSWAVDENLNTYDDTQRITISNSIISEGLSDSSHPGGEHSKGYLGGGQDAHDVSFHHNLLVSNMDRNPQISGLSVADLVNNVIYNYGDGSGGGVTLISSSKGEPRINWVGNYYKPGPDSDPGRPEFALYSGSTGDTWQWYGADNMRWTSSGDMPARLASGASSARVTVAFAAPPVTTMSAAEAYTYVLANAGASLHRDAVDARIVDNVQNGTGSIIDDPSEVGGYPTLPIGTAPADSDHDGMPDAWETARGLDPNSDDSAADRNGDGYTNIEEYLNLLAGE